MPDEIETAAEEVVKAFGMWRLPVNPFDVAREEGVRVVPGVYGESFDARIEYYPAYGRFVIFYRDVGRPEGRIRFSIAHELAHFYLPTHRQRLEEGRMHSSKPDFRSREPLEQEADRFAAGLLMPRLLFRKAVNDFRQSVCTLRELCTLADRLETSITSTVVRYCECDIEGSAAVFSENGVVRWTCASEDMRRLGLSFVRSGSSIPRGSKTAQLLERMHAGQPSEIVDGIMDSRIWFDRPQRPRLYEEAMKLGDRVLTWLTIDT